MEKKSKKLHKHHRLVPILLIAGGIPVALVCLFILLGNAFVHDEQAPNDQALRVPAVHIADEENAFFEMQQIILMSKTEASVEPDHMLEQMLHGENWNDAHAAKLILDNRKAIDLFHVAVSKPKYQDPIYAEPDKLDWNSVSYYMASPRDIAKIVTLEGQLKARQGDVRGGLTNAVEVVRMGHLMQQNNISVIEYLVGSSIKQIGLNGIRQIARNYVVPTDLSKSTASQLDQYADSRAGQLTAMKIEYAFGRRVFARYKTVVDIFAAYTGQTGVNGEIISEPNMWVELFDGLGLGRYYYLPNQTWRFAIEMTKERNARGAVSCSRVVPAEMETRFKTFRTEGPLRFFEPNAIGKFILETGQVSFGGFNVKRCNEGVSIAATQTALGISAFKAEHNALPASLNELVPTYLEKVPVDPYSSGAMIYSAEKKTVYSVGPNRKDIGGSAIQSDWQQLDNPTFQVSN